MKNKFFNTILTCRVCEKNALETIFDTAYLSLASPNTGIEPSEEDNNEKNKVPLTFSFCKNCLNIQINETVDPNILYKNFKYVSAITHGLADHFKEFAAECFKVNKLSNKDLILDIGSNDGSLLKPFKSLGCKVLGVEPAIELANKITDTGINTIGQFFNHSLAKEIKKKYGVPKIITCNNTIANIDNLNDFCLGIKELTGDDTLIYIETQYGMDVLKKNLIDTIYHEHLNYFTIKSISYLFAKHGLYVSSHTLLTNKGGSIRMKFNNYQSESKEKNVPVETIENISDFISQNRSVNERCKIEINQLLEIAKSNKKSIYLFGSSVSCVSLATQINFNLVDIKCILDENPLASKCIINEKILNIYKLKEIELDKDSIVLNLAYRYSDIIYSKNINKFSKIKFINIFPKIQNIN